MECHSPPQRLVKHTYGVNVGPGLLLDRKHWLLRTTTTSVAVLWFELRAAPPAATCSEGALEHPGGPLHGGPLPRCHAWPKFPASRRPPTFLYLESGPRLSVTWCLLRPVAPCVCCFAGAYITHTPLAGHWHRDLPRKHAPTSWCTRCSSTECLVCPGWSPCRLCVGERI